MTKFYQVATIVLPVRQGEGGGDEAGLPDARSLATAMGQGLGREVVVASHTTNEHVLADLREIRRFMLMQANGDHRASARGRRAGFPCTRRARALPSMPGSALTAWSRARTIRTSGARPLNSEPVAPWRDTTKQERKGRGAKGLPSRLFRGRALRARGREAAEYYDEITGMARAKAHLRRRRWQAGIA